MNDDYERNQIKQIVDWIIELEPLIQAAAELKGYWRGLELGNSKPKSKVITNKWGQLLKIEFSSDNHFPTPPPSAEPQHIDKLIDEKQETSAFLKFTEKEILKMPKQFRKEFRVDGCTARITKRKSGKNNFCYEIRYRRNGHNIAASSTNLQTAKDKFIKKLHFVTKPNEPKEPPIPTTFHKFAMHYFNSFYIMKVSDGTYKKMLEIYNRYIFNHFQSIELKAITPSHYKVLFDTILSKGHGRTCEDVRTILNLVFKMACVYHLMHFNPIDVIPYQKHERTPSKAISKENEKKLLKNIEKTNHLIPVVLMLYAGLRPNEIYTAKIDGDFIVANNSKRKNNKKELKKIAISPMLKPYLTKGFNASSFCLADTIKDAVKKILPNHTLKDLRATFSTRCQECGVDRDVIKIFMGHSLGDVLGKHYTDFSDEYLLSEMKKAKY